MTLEEPAPSGRRVGFDLDVQADFVADCDRVPKLLAERLHAHGGSISAEPGIGLV